MLLIEWEVSVGGNKFKKNCRQACISLVVFFLNYVLECYERKNI